MAKITLRNLIKQYKDGEVQALRDLSFECKDGEFFCLLGPAGAGKTTAVKLIAGVEAVDAGTILLDDQDVTDRLPKERDVAVAFETYALYPQRTVRENLTFPLRAPGRKQEWNDADIAARVVEIAHLLGIDELLDRLPRQLSGGQRQRVALGRALVRKPRAYLLDEPIAHLDAKLRHRMRGELKRIQLETGVTTLYTTPDQLEALSLADTLAVINDGQLEQVGPPDEVYKRPANVFVARFVGDPPMNFMDAALDGGELLVHDLLRLPITPRAASTLNGHANGPAVTVGVRPKDIRVLAQGTAEALAQAEVKHVQVLGETSILTLLTDSLELHVKLATPQAPRRGEQVGLAFSIDDCHFFDPGTQQRIG